MVCRARPRARSIALLRTRATGCQALEITGDRERNRARSLQLHRAPGGGGVCPRPVCVLVTPPSQPRLAPSTSQRYIARMAKHTSAERAEILEAVFEGMTNGQTLADTCRKLKVSAGMVRQWIARDEDLSHRYQRLRPLLGAALAEEAIRVARESTSQTTAMDRVLIETLKWAAAKSAPVEYGDKQVVQHEGQQTLQVKVIEDEAPVRNVKALKEAAVTAVLQAASSGPMALPAPDRDEIA